MDTNSVSTVRRMVGVAAVGAITLAACGSDEDAGPAGTDPGDVASTVPATGGWVGGEPDWGGGDEGGVAFETEFADAPAMSEESATEAATEPGEAPMPVEVDSGLRDDIVMSSPAEPLRAGSVDDGADFAGFLEYVERVTGAGFVARDADLRGRVVVRVADESGAPVPGAAVLASPVGADGSVVDAEPIRGRTTADGTVRLFPGLHGFDPGQGLAVGLADGSVEPVVVPPAADPEGGDVADRDVALTAAPMSLADPVPLDVLFLLDATGSMGDEIGRLKTTIDTVADRVNELAPRPDVRFAMTLYRDVGDAFVSSTFDFTADVGIFRDALADVVADGGGDYPEALDEGLAEALAAPAWRDPGEAVQLVFLVADAPPQISRQVDTPYTESIRTAIERGTKIFPIASSESDDVAELVFRQLAVTTGAPFVFLSYGAGGAATGGATDIERTDYEELALDELVVRLIAEELADLSGGVEPVPPTTVAPPTTNPDGQ